jgi:hypothetical protein
LLLRPGPPIAFSLKILQERANEFRGHLPEELTQLSGLNRIQGIATERAGEVLLLGDRDPLFPPIHLDDLVVALRNAYQVSPAYRGTLGCTIDPMVGSTDPWRMQEVQVFGMPATAPMGARHVALDYELKKVSAGLLSIGKDIPGIFEMMRSARPLCDGSPGKEDKKEMTHRFWFYPLYPEHPRFMDDGAVTLVLKPVEVQLLTEQEVLDKRGARKGAAAASPDANEFARSITKMLASGNIPRYAQLRNDFRVIELGQLLRFKHVAAKSLRYLLEDYALPEVKAPAFVGGIRREEQGEAVCSSEINERQTTRGRLLEAKDQIQRYHFKSRGGVEARVTVQPENFTAASSGALSDLHQRIMISRPSNNALQWKIRYGFD